jgi:hypothetical protein
MQAKSAASRRTRRDWLKFNAKLELNLDFIQPHWRDWLLA